MSRLHKSVAVAIVLCLVGLSTAWAFDAHAVDDSQPERLIDVSDTTPLPDKHSHNEDHCCHGGAHLVGLDQAAYLILPVTQSVPRPPASRDLFVSQASAPPLRPPQSA